MSVELPEHELDEDGDHEPEECQKCIEKQYSCECDCRCGDCCRSLIIETTMLDAVREPLIAQLGSPMKDIGEEPVGYLLNHGESNHCVFLDEATNQCKIWETRPGVCRVFDCKEIYDLR